MIGYITNAYKRVCSETIEILSIKLKQSDNYESTIFAA